MNTQTHMTDSEGRLVPISKVKPEHIEEDALVRRIAIEARVLNRELGAFKAMAFDEVTAFRALIAEQYGSKKGGKKGNITLKSYDGSMQIQVAIAEHITFGAELSAAKDLIDECVIEWSAGSNDNVRVLIEHAFQTNKLGRIDTGRVLGLRRLKIDDPKWLRAMDAISDAIRVTGSKTYLRVYQADDDGKMNPISLDLANV